MKSQDPQMFHRFIFPNPNSPFNTLTTYSRFGQSIKTLVETINIRPSPCNIPQDLPRSNLGSIPQIVKQTRTGLAA